MNLRIKRSLRPLLVMLLLAAGMLAAGSLQPALAANGGLSGANIKDGVLEGYYGDGGDIVIPNTVTSIAGEALKGNDNVTSVTIPGSVSTIGYNAFEGCTALERVVFSDPEDGAPLTIRINAFQNCPKLTDVEIPACCKYVTANIFKGCTSMKEIKVDKNNPYYASEDGVLYGPWVKEGEPQYSDPNYALIGYPAGRKPGTFTVPEAVNGHTVNQIWAGAFDHCTNLTGINFPATVKKIGGYAFNSSGLREITIPDTVEVIDSCLFGGCSDLTDVTFPDSYSELSAQMFLKCTSLQRVTMNGVRSIGYEAFMDCTSLTNVVLPDSVVNVGLNLFSGCSNLQRVFLPASITTYPGDSDLGSYDLFKNTPSSMMVYVVKGSTGEKYAVNNADSFGWKYTVLDNAAALDKTDMGSFSLMDMGRRVKLTGAFSIRQSLKVSDVAEGSTYEAFASAADDKALKVYRLKLLPEGSSVKGSMDLAIAVPSGILSKDAALYTLKAGSPQQLKTTMSGKTLKTSVDSLGYFAVIGDPDTSADPQKPVEAESVTLNKSQITIKAGKSAMLSTTVLPGNATDKTILWSSSNEEVATVKNGTVTGVAPGVAVITATTTNGKSASCEVVVTDPSEVAAAKAEILSPKRSGADGSVPFRLVLSGASRIANIEIKFETDADDLTITPSEGFTLIGEPVIKTSGDKKSYTAVLAYLHAGQLYSADAASDIAVLSASGETPSVTINSLRISGWKADNKAVYGKVTSLNKDTVTFVPLSKYDLNEDYAVDKLDLEIAESAYRSLRGEAPFVEGADFNEDNVIDLADLVEISANFTE